MSWIPRRTLVAAIGLAALALAPLAAQSQHQDGTIRIEDPWIRATPAGAQVAGGYMTLQNAGTEPDRLVGGSTTAAGKFEIHEMEMDGSIMRMRELPDGLELKPGQSVELKPGSYHLMLIGLKQPLKAGDKVKVTLEFAKAGKVELEYPVRRHGSQDGGAADSHGSGHDGSHDGSHGKAKH